MASMNIVIGLFFLVLSILILLYRVPIRHFLGQVEWAERMLGPGGTYTFLLALAVFLFFLSLAVMTGALDVFFGGFLKQFFGSVK